MSLSHIVSIIVEQFLPEQHRKYLFLNFQMDPTYRAYNTHVPSYLQGRPRNVIIHCLVREEKAKKNSHLKTSHQQIRKLVSSLFVANQGTSTQLTLELKLGKPNCTCQDWAKNNLPCKQFFLIFITTDEWGWSFSPTELSKWSLSLP